MSIFSSNIFGPTCTSDESGGYPYYYIEPGNSVLVESFQQYVIHERNYLSICGSIEVSAGGEVLIGEI